MSDLKTKLLSIMFTDMKGFTTKAATQSRQQLQHLLEMQDQLIKPAIAQFDGTIIKTIGDAFMVSFESPTDAVLCGMKIQENVINHNLRAPSSDQIEVRIAVNSGEVNLKDGDVFGEPVNIASRIESISEPNEVYFTESIYLSMNKNEIPTAEVGHRRLKGIPEEIKVYKVISENTNLLRAKIKRQEQAEANANLKKDEINAGEMITPELVATVRSPHTAINWKKYLAPALGILAVIIIIALTVKVLGNGKEKVNEKDTFAQPENVYNPQQPKTNQPIDQFQSPEAKMQFFLDELSRLDFKALPPEKKRALRDRINNELQNNDFLTQDQRRQLEKYMGML